MTRSARAQDVADVLAITFEREDAAGHPWCPPADAATVRHWVVDRSKELGGGIRRAVRLARLAQLADGRDYTRFLYVRLATLRGRGFAAALQAAQREGRLTSLHATLGPAAVTLREAGLQLQSGATGEGFEIGFTQMPRLVALLDLLHNALGYTTVADTLQPVLAGTPAPGAADKAARELHSAFNAWLSERLESPHHLRQAQLIRAFIAGRGRLAPETIDDAAILAFWQMAALGQDAAEVEGFRLFASAARAVLRYRRSLGDVAEARAIANAADLDGESGTGGVDLDRLVPAELVQGTWQSPLDALARKPANAVKWLNRRERIALANYLGGPHPDDDVDDPAGDEPAERVDEEGGGLMGPERFDLRFRLTLLRADVFGAVQAAIVARLRKRAAPGAALTEALAGLDDAAYESARAAYAEVGAQIGLECHAALHALLEAGAPEALLLLDACAGSGATSALLERAPRSGAAEGLLGTAEHPLSLAAATDDDEGSETIDPEPLRAAIAKVLASPADLPEPIRAAVTAARAAARKVNREGFRPTDRVTPDGIAALSAGLVPITSVRAELQRLGSALDGMDLGRAAADDRAVFHAALTALYDPPQR